MSFALLRAFPPRTTWLRAGVAGLLSALLVVSGLIIADAAPARADSAPLNPADPATPPTVSADALPTVQVNGVVWSQVVVGNTVYAAGKFTRARPPGAAPGTGEVVRNNLLAYDITTGQLVSGFAPDLNAQALVVAASPDGSTLYVGGDFTQANGQPRYRLAAYSTASGALLASFQPAFNGEVSAIAATSSTVYVGGIDWGSAGGAPRNFLAAFSPSNGAVTSWAPGADNQIQSLLVVNGGQDVIVAGAQSRLNATTVHGIGMVDAVTGATKPFAAAMFTENYGVNSAFLSLSADNDTVYASAYSYGSGNLEGILAMKPSDGTVKWVDDCRGDSYSVYATGTAEYQAGHHHDCSNIGGWPQVHPENDALWTYRRAVAFSKAATGTVGSVYPSFTGQPSPSILTWFPQLEPGSFTGQDQAAWSVTGNGTYVVYGGEFPSVNGTPQQGLVRFAPPSMAANKLGPDASALTAPTFRSYSSGTVRMSFSATSDPDNATLRYDIYRSDKPGAPVGSLTAASKFWDLQTLVYTDTTAPPGQAVSYRVTALDPYGNSAQGPSASVTVSTATVSDATPDRYSRAVMTDSPSNYWRLGESSGNTSFDQAGTNDLTLGSGVTLRQPGALAGLPNTAASFSGASGGVGLAQTSVHAPGVFTEEAWFKTTSKTGGTLMNFGTSASTTATSPQHDRQISLDGSGRVLYGVYDGAVRTVQSQGGYNDGKWHHVAAELGQTGLILYLDGVKVAGDSSVQNGEASIGYWRIGGDTTWDGTGPYLAATIDDVAIYPVALSAAQVAAHYSAGITSGPNTPPTAAFTSTVSNLSVALDGSASADADGSVAAWAWDFGDGGTGAGKTVSHAYAAAGTYTVKLTVTDNAGGTGTLSKAVTVTSPPANTPPTAAFTSTVSNLSVALDGSASADADGSVAVWAWDFGDGGTGAGKTVSHAYPAAGTYTVKLTVTDNAGGTGSVTHPVTVTAPPAGAALASDAFGRSVTSGWGSADVGGAWTILGTTANASVGGGSGSLTAAKGAGILADLPVSVQDVAVQADVALTKAASGGGTFVNLAGRNVGGNQYNAQLWFASDGTMWLSLLKEANGVESDLGDFPLPGTYTVGQAITVRLDVSGSGTTTLHAKAWTTGSAEPAAWQLNVTDTEAGLQRAGGLEVQLYTSVSATATQTIKVDNLWAGPAGTKPQ